MSVRGDREREIAAAMHAIAREHHRLAAAAPAARRHRVHERTAQFYEDVARQHRQRASMYDAEEAEQRNFAGGALV